jgi:hypothetical protein
MAVNKKIGGHAQGANDFLAPYAPTIGTATNVPSGRAFNNGRADVTFTPDARNAATSFTVTSSPGGYTGTGSASPITVTGLQSNTSYTFTVTGANAAGTSAASAASNSITATTVPDTVATPSVSTAASGDATVPQGTANTATDTVSWSAPANGGSAITNYHWTSSDGKSGDTGSTSITVAQESGTGQTYSVYATNTNGNGGTGTSGSITSAFSFTPFSVFGFSPFSVFGFSPFGVFGFSPFGFSPFGVFGFSPFGVFGFSPFGFSPYGFSTTVYGIRCIDGETFIRVKSGQGTESVDSETGKVTLKNSAGEVIAKKAKDIVVGDTVLSASITEIDPASPDYEVFTWKSDSLTFVEDTETTIVDIEEQSKIQAIYFNGDESSQFTLEHPILVKKTIDGVSEYAFSMVAEIEIGNSILKYNPSTDSYDETVINSIDISSGEKTVYTFSAEPHDLIIAGDIITHNK